MASITTSGVCEPPGPSRNAAGRPLTLRASAGKRRRSAGTSSGGVVVTVTRPSVHQLRFSPMSSAIPDRNLALELVRVTEAAALAASRWVGRGDKNAADGAAVDAMRATMAGVSMDGVVVIGEGEKDEAPMLWNGERIGDGSAPVVDIAVDPIDGTTATSLGRGNAVAVIAMSERGTMFDPGPCVYMDKIAVGPEAAGRVALDRSPTENLEAVADALGKQVRELTAVILDRDRHAD